MAEFYDQRFQSKWTEYYPVPMGWREDAPVSVKLRKFGKFIGIRGCESPTKGAFVSPGEDLTWKKKWC
jgi:hypothetical protein